MKRSLSLLLVSLFTFSFISAQETTVFLETFGSPALSYRPVVNDFTGWDNKSPVVYSSTTSPLSPGNNYAEIDYQFAFVNNNHLSIPYGYNIDFLISNINASGYKNLKLSFDIATEALDFDPELIGFANVNRMELTCNGEVIELPDMGFQTRRTPKHVSDILLPAADVLNLRMYYAKENNPSMEGGYRIDNIKITGEAEGGSSISLNEANSVKIYPNPVTDYLHLDGDFDEAVLYNMNGQNLLNITEKIVNVSGLASGVYFLKVTTGVGISTYKVIIK